MKNVVKKYTPTKKENTQPKVQKWNTLPAATTAYILARVI